MFLCCSSVHSRCTLCLLARVSINLFSARFHYKSAPVYYNAFASHGISHPDKFEHTCIILIKSNDGNLDLLEFLIRRTSIKQLISRFCACLWTCCVIILVFGLLYTNKVFYGMFVFVNNNTFLTAVITMNSQCALCK